MKDRLKQIRQNIGKSQRDMATLISIAYKSWQGYESGDNVPGGNVLQSLAKLGFNINWILTGEGGMRTADIKNTCESTGQVNEVGYSYVPAQSSIPNIQNLMRDLIDIMDSNDEGTKIAIAQSITMFKESVRRKQQLESKPDPREDDFKTLGPPGKKQAGGGNGE